MPTANIDLSNTSGITYGIYSARVEILDGPEKGRYDGCASVGVKPTMGTFAPCLEVHVFDFDDNIYGSRLSVERVTCIRSEEKFEHVQLRLDQMKLDLRQAKAD